jgi:cytidine deaminase
MMSVRGIVFDMDGVLCDSEPFIRAAAKQMFAERYQLNVDDASFMPFVGMGEDRFLGGPAEEHGVTIQLPEDKVTTYQLYLEQIKGKLRPLAGVQSFVDRCQDAGLALAVYSAADAMKVEGNLAEIGLEPDRWQALITGNQVQRKKPDPEGYLMACDALGHAGSECLVIEDAVSGVAAGKAAGCRVLGITSSFSGIELLAAGADWTARDLASLPADLEDLLSEAGV